METRKEITELLEQIESEKILTYIRIIVSDICTDLKGGAV